MSDDTNDNWWLDLLAEHPCVSDSYISLLGEFRRLCGYAQSLVRERNTLVAKHQDEVRRLQQRLNNMSKLNDELLDLRRKHEAVGR